MACYSPLVAFQTDSGEIVFAERGKIRRELKLPCGQCVGCKLERSRQWAVRCMHEASMYDANSYVTLTFDDDHLPDDYSLNHKYFQDFMKRLRKRKGHKIRYYMCGEYGTDRSRPHFHAILFNCFFPDRKYFKKSPAGFSLYISDELSDIWSNGNILIGDVSFESAAYVARYCIVDTGQEFILDPLTGELIERKREYNRMSLKPGIGSTWYNKYKNEVYPHDRVVSRGVEMKPPKYYDKLLAALDSSTMIDDVQYARFLKSRRLIKDNTPDRLATREHVARAKLKLIKRSI